MQWEETVNDLARLNRVKIVGKKKGGKKGRKEGSRVIYHRTDEFIIEPRQAALVFSGQTIPCGIVGRLIVHFHLSVRADGLTKKGASPIPKKRKPQEDAQTEKEIREIRGGLPLGGAYYRRGK